MKSRLSLPISQPNPCLVGTDGGKMTEHLIDISFIDVSVVNRHT